MFQFWFIFIITFIMAIHAINSTLNRDNQRLTLFLNRLLITKYLRSLESITEFRDNLNAVVVAEITKLTFNCEISLSSSKHSWNSSKF